MLNRAFCESLEIHITHAFPHFLDESFKHYWCDGVLLPTFEFEYAQKLINDKRQISLIAFLGKTGQDEYELILLFGNKSLSRNARGLDIQDCIPDPENVENYSIDMIKRKLTIQLL